MEHNVKEKLYVIDGHALCYRAYYAFIRNPLFNSSGQNTSAIFGFARMLYKLIEEQNPDYLVVAFDPPKKSFRFNVYPEYKANRQKMPDDLKYQVEEIKNMVAVMGLKQVENDNYEADDVMGTIAKKYSSKDLEVMLVTGDKDAYQLVDENIKIYANKKGISEYEIYDSDSIKEKLGLVPDQIIDYMALMGDSSDNIPGVKGIGEKSAQKLIEKFGNLDSVYDNLEEIKGKQKEMLITDKEAAYLSKDLVTIRTDVPIEINVSELNFNNIKSEDVKEYFNGLEMNSIVDNFFIEEEVIRQIAEDRKYEIIRNEKDLNDMINEIKKKGIVSFDSETTSTSPIEGELVGLSFSIKENHGWYVPMTSSSLFSEDFLERQRSLELIKPLLEDPEVKKIGQNIKYDIIILKGEGIFVKGVYFDTMVASYLLNPSERRHNMDDMAMKFLGYKTITFKELVGTGKSAITITDVPLDKLSEYAIEDADITFRLYCLFKEKLVEAELDRLFFEIEMPLVSVLVEMEYTGVKIDPAHFKKLSTKNDRILNELEEKIYEIAGQIFNINSTRELSLILFEKIGLKPVKKTKGKTGYSTDIKVLEALKGSHEIIEHLINFRTFNKLKNTYIDTLPDLISTQTGRIHTSYNQTVVATGRLSSSGPNLQNIPIRDEFGKQIRGGFVADKGYNMISADYSQIELRLAAHLSKDENLIKAFRDGVDIHSMTAASVFGVEIDKVDSDMRRQAKIINFATIYGVSPYGLSQQAGMNIQDAADFIEKYFIAFPGVKNYIQETISYAKENGFVKTLLGRKRYIPDEINSSNRFRREGAERIAINTPIQGTSADMIKIAMIDIMEIFSQKKFKTKMIMQVHDELVFEVYHEEEDDVKKIIIDKMENALEVSIPIVVDVGVGENWDESH